MIIITEKKLAHQEFIFHLSTCGAPLNSSCQTRVPTLSLSSLHHKKVPAAGGSSLCWRAEGIASPERSLRHGQVARDVDKHGRCFGFGALRLLIVLGLEKHRWGFRAAPRLLSPQLVPDTLLRILLLIALLSGGGDLLRQRGRW